MLRALAIVAAVVVATVVVLGSLTILDVLTTDELWQTLSDFLAVAGLATAGLLAIMRLLQLARPRADPTRRDGD